MKFETIEIQEKAGSQSIEIPQDFKINDDKVYLKQVGNALYVIPFHNPWQNLIESVEAFTPDYMNDREQPGEQTREIFE